MPGRLVWRNRSRSRAVVQEKLAFAARADKMDRAFKRSIIAFSALAMFGLVAGTPPGRNAAVVTAYRCRALFNRVVGLPSDPWLNQQQMLAQRIRNAASARETLAKTTTPGSAIDLFMRAARMDSKSAVIRWGNVNHSIVLSSAVFEPDDNRSYRLKPGVRSVWVIRLSLKWTMAMFLIPDTPEARDSASRAGGIVVPESLQSTNSWGCRGQEPDLIAPVRVLVLGDSMMQGALVGDNDTPPARLEAHLSEALNARVSVLNTGHIGYSLEQYSQTLSALGDRFEPHYVVVSVSENDFADLDDPESWTEGAYWLERILDQCRSKGWHFLVVPCADESALLGLRHRNRFEGEFSRIEKCGGMDCVNLIPSFTEALLRLRIQQARRGDALWDPLFNLHLLGDRHFSSLGADLWARVVARRLLLVWDGLALIGRPSPEPVVRHARRDHPPIPDLDSAGGTVSSSDRAGLGVRESESFIGLAVAARRNGRLKSHTCEHPIGARGDDESKD